MENTPPKCGCCLCHSGEKTRENERKQLHAWIIMELLQGSMSEVIEASQQEEVGSLTLREQVDMACDSLHGLNYLHSLVSHWSIHWFSGSYILSTFSPKLCHLLAAVFLAMARMDSIRAIK